MYSSHWIGARVVIANRVAVAMLRAKAADVLGRPLDEVFRIANELTRAPVESPVARVLQEGTVVGLANHTVLIARDGTETPIDDSGAPIRVENGPVQGAVLVFRDITERRGTERAARLLASLVESSADGIISLDLNGIVTTWNRGAGEIFGYTAEEITGQPISLATGRGGFSQNHFARIRLWRAAGEGSPSALACPTITNVFQTQRRAVDTIADIIREVFEVYQARPEVCMDRSARRIESALEFAQRRPTGIVLQLPHRAS